MISLQYSQGENYVADKYEIRRFRAAEKVNLTTRRAVAWLRGVGFGFHDERHKDEFVDKVMAMYRADNREMTGVYQTGSVAAHSLAADIPVATFGTLRKTSTSATAGSSKRS